MTSIATLMDKATESLAEAMTGVAKTLMQPRAVSPGLPANAATKDAHMTATTDSRKTAIQIIKEEEGFSDNDLASAANCIISNEELAKMYVSLKSQGARTALIQSHMQRNGRF
ncbi:hypothetical protein EI94DRAFT_1707125 [Lactarius quietus]|nr:hypothetical protein EI94DRAFT_1707125 [Lactarius quietus]